MKWLGLDPSLEIDEVIGIANEMLSDTKTQLTQSMVADAVGATMDGLNVYETYIAVRAAFTTDYDYFKYGGKIKLSQEAFLKHKNKWQFVGIGRQFVTGKGPFSEIDFPYYLAFTFFTEGVDESWITKLLEDRAKNFKAFAEFKEYNDDRVKSLKKDLETIRVTFELESMDDFKKMIIVPEDKQFPILLRFQTEDEISVSTLFILDYYLNLFTSWDRKLAGDYLWDEFYKRYQAFKPFFVSYRPMSDVHLKKVIKEAFTF